MFVWQEIYRLNYLPSCDHESSHISHDVYHLFDIFESFKTILWKYTYHPDSVLWTER